MISSQLQQVIPDLDEIINLEELDFQQSGLKQSSLIRASRLAVVAEEIFIGKLGNIDTLKLNKIRATSPNGYKTHNQIQRLNPAKIANFSRKQ